MKPSLPFFALVLAFGLQAQSSRADISELNSGNYGTENYNYCGAEVTVRAADHKFFMSDIKNPAYTNVDCGSLGTTYEFTCDSGNNNCHTDYCTIEVIDSNSFLQNCDDGRSLRYNRY